MTRRTTIREKLEKLQRYEAADACGEWNRQYPIGTPVRVRKDNDSVHHGQTRSEALVAQPGYAVIFVTGIAGYYLLDRVTPEAEAAQKSPSQGLEE